MSSLIQYRTHASLYDGPFGGDTGWPSAGMGYIIRTDAGRLIVVDGGHPEDAADFLALLEAQSDGMPTVEKWILTHPHGDHYGALAGICRDEALAARIRVKELIYHFPEEFRDKRGNGIGYVFPEMERIHAVTGAVHTLPAVDERMTVDEVELHFLYTPTDCSILDNPNQLSLIFTVKAERTLMITGDAYHRTMQIAVWRYGNALKADILQMPHHGLCDTGNMEFYKKVNAETVLIPISRAGDRAMKSGIYGTSPDINRWAEENANTAVRMFEGEYTASL